MNDIVMTEEAVLKPKRIRTKTRKVQKGLRIVIECGGKQHYIVWTKKGHMVMTHHPDIDLNAELAMRSVGGCDICRCAEFIGAWRSGNGLTSVCPRTMIGVRPSLKPESVGIRAWRKMRSKSEHLHKQQKPVPWPTSEDEMHTFLTDAFKRVGLLYGGGIVTNEGIQDGKAPTVILQLEWDQVKNNRFTMQNSTVPGLNYKRYVTPDNYEMLIELIGRYMFRNLVAWRIKRKEEDTLLAETHSLHMLQRKLAKNINIYTSGHGGTQDIQFSFRVPYLQRGASAYILKNMEKLKHFAELSVSTRKSTGGSDT
jgi:hypothetical protein